MAALEYHNSDLGFHGLAAPGFPLRGDSTLSLFMAGIAAHDMHDAAAPYDLAFIANSLDTGSYFHGRRSPTAGMEWFETSQYTHLWLDPSRAFGRKVGSRAPSNAIWPPEIRGSGPRPRLGPCNHHDTITSGSIGNGALATSSGVGGPVRQIGPSAVMAIVCSKWALGLPSFVT